MKCGECIAYGYNSCTTAPDYNITNKYDEVRTKSDVNRCFDHFGFAGPPKNDGLGIPARNVRTRFGWEGWTCSN